MWKTAGNIKANQMQQVAPMKAMRFPKSGIISTIIPVSMTRISLRAFYSIQHQHLLRNE